jgi:ribokinase
MSADVVVVGSANIDVVLHVAAIPAPGETVLATGRGTGPGGKGANQAIAAARAGARVAFLGSCGADEGGRLLHTELQSAGVDVSASRTSDTATGTAYVIVDARGENAIVVDAGANADLVDLSASEADLVHAARVLLCQLEIPLPTVAAAAEAAGGLRILNAAPAHDVSLDVASVFDVVIVNESEALALSGAASVDDAVLALRSAVAELVVTLGPAGALVANGHATTRVQGIAARQVVDTTGAGDTFCGAYAAARAEGADAVAAARFGCAAASLSVERPGAGRSSPELADVRSRLEQGS